MKSESKHCTDIIEERISVDGYQQEEIGPTQESGLGDTEGTNQMELWHVKPSNVGCKQRNSGERTEEESDASDLAGNPVYNFMQFFSYLLEILLFQQQ